MEWRRKDLLAERTIDPLRGPRSVLPPPSATAEPSQERARQPSASIRRTLSAVTGVLEVSSDASPCSGRPLDELLRDPGAIGAAYGSRREIEPPLTLQPNAGAKAEPAPVPLPTEGGLGPGPVCWVLDSST